MKRADNKRANGNGTSTSAALPHGAAPNGARHRRLTSLRPKPAAKGAWTAWFLRRLVPVVGLTLVGLVATVMVYSVSRLDHGFGYDTEYLRGKGTEHYRVQKPLPLSPPPPPPPPPPQPREPENKSGEGQAAAVAAATTLPPSLPSTEGNGGTTAAGGPQGAGGGGDGAGKGSKGSGPLKGDSGSLGREGGGVNGEEGKGEGAGQGETARQEAQDRERERGRERERERGGRVKKSFSRVKDATTQGQWKGGHVGEKIEIGDSSWDIAPRAPASSFLSAAAADLGKRPVIINADEEGLGGGSARWMPGQLIRLAELQQQQRDEEDEEEGGGVSRTRMLGADAALLIICANRPEYLERTLKAVADYHPGSSRGAEAAIPVVISQDGSSQKVREVISRFQLSMAGRAHVIHVQHTPPPRENRAYFKLSAHYEWALRQVFDEIDVEGYDWATKDKVIILEEDLEIAPDFFEYFSAMAPLLDSDETLMAVSAWNDNGQAAHVKDNEALFRSDFFPGLGWMLPRRVWEELSPGWPEAYWDDWLRAPERRRGRQFIRPEVCRTYHFGQKAGASKNQFGALLNSIKLNTEPVPFREMDVSYLEPEAFRNRLGRVLRDVPVESIAAVKAGRSLSPEVVVEYGGEKEFESSARQLGIMQDSKAGIPRTAYMGVVSVWVGDTKVYLAPRGASRQMLQS